MIWPAEPELLGRHVRAPFVQEMPMNQYSSDVSDNFLQTLIGNCLPGRLDCDPKAFVGCWLSESGLSPRAQNKSALAAGFFQAMPKILRGMGFKGDAQYGERVGAYDAADEQGKRALDQALSDAFCRLSLEAQLAWAFRYYRPHAGKLVNAGACYAANFVPAWIDHAGDAAWVICAKGGRSDGGLTPAESEEWYRENEALDVDHDGLITMGDLAAKAQHAADSPRGRELLARLEAMRDESGVVAELRELAAEPPELEPS